MTIALKLLEYLEWTGVDYDFLRHPKTATSMVTAEKAQVSGDDLAKAVVLKDDGGYVMAVIPATHHLDVEAVQHLTGRSLVMIDEDQLAQLFDDCEAGAVPPVGQAYGYEVIVDERLDRRDEVFIEAGDHLNLLHLDHGDFEKLMGGARRGRISRHL